MKIVVLTHGGSYAKDILCELQARGLRVHAVLIPATQRDFKSQKRKLRRYSPRQIAHIAATRIIDHLDRSLRPERHMNPVDEYNGFAESVIQCGALNSDEMIDNLARLQPDLLLLAGCGIISSEIISIPTLSTINVHPGLLPWCRGVNVIEHSILRGVAVGVSAHIVDTGIDTGTILTRKLLPVQPYDSLASLRTKSTRTSVVTMADIAASYVAANTPNGYEQSSKYRYCKQLSDKQQHEVQEYIRQGRATELYNKWKQAFDGDTLPNRLVKTPDTYISPQTALPQNAHRGTR